MIPSNGFLEKINSLKQKNKKHIDTIFQKKMRKAVLEPVDYIDLFIKGHDFKKEINSNQIKNLSKIINTFIGVDINKWKSLVARYVEMNIYSNRYRGLFSKILSKPIKLIDEQKYEDIFKHYFARCHSDLLFKNGKVKEYLLSRKCSLKLMIDFKLGTNEYISKDDFPELETLFSYKRTSVTFPSLTGFGGFRNINLETTGIYKYFFLRGRTDLYGYIREGKTLAICEGIFDTMALSELKVPSAISFGTCAPSFISLKKLFDLINHLQITEILFAFDLDAGGTVLLDQIKKILPTNLSYKLLTGLDVCEDPYEAIILNNKACSFEEYTPELIESLSVDVIDWHTKSV